MLLIDGPERVMLGIARHEGQEPWSDEVGTWIVAIRSTSIDLERG